MKSVLSIIAVLTTGLLVIGQTGPGGVGSSATNSFWLDANSLNYANNDNVSTIDDISTNGNSFSQLVSSRQPIFKTGAVNGLPAIEFDGVNDYMRSGAISALDSPELTWYVVYKMNTADGGILGGSYTSRVRQWLSYSLSSGLTVNGHYSTGSLNYAGFTQTAGTYLFSGTHVTSSDIKSYRNSNLMQTKVAAYTAPSGHTYTSLGHIPGITYAGLFDGCVAEAFVYNTSVNDLERVIIENYLGAKYDIAIANDFYAYESTHNIGVIGIGDDGTNSHSDSKGAGIVNISAPTAMGSNEYLFVGNDGVAAFPLVNADMPAAIAATHERFNRTWRVGETGDVGDITLTFNLGASFGFANVSSYFLLVDNDGNFTDATTVLGTYNAGNQTVSFTVNLADGEFFTLAGEPVPTIVNAISDGDWSNTTTWDCACVPSGFQTVDINGFHVDLDIDGFAKDLTLHTGSNLHWTGTETLTIKEDFDIGGLIDMMNGTLEMNGDGNNQSIQLNGQVVEMNNLNIVNPGATVSVLSGSLGLNGTLSPNSGTLDVSSTNFIVRSDSPTTSGRIGPIAASASITGSVTVERFIAAGVAGNRNLCSPVIGETLASWDNDLAISGTGFPDGCAYGSFGGTTGDSLTGCYYSVKKHQGSSYIDVTNINETLLSGVGYEIFIGDDLSTFSGATVSVTGTLHGGSYTTPSFSYFWNLQGNPFASPISFQDVTLSHVGNYFYIFDAASGSYQWYDGTSNTSSIPTLANGVISIGQGFWTGDWGFITYPQAAKTSATATFIRNSEVENALELTLKQDNSTFFNVASLSFNEEATDEVDHMDIHYLSTGFETASSIFMQYNDTLRLAKNYLERNGETKMIDFVMNCKTESYYTISPSNISDLQDYSRVYLYDKELNTMVNLGEAGSYTFFSSVGEFNRFTIILTNDLLSDKTYIKANNEEMNSAVTITQLGHTIELDVLEALTEGAMLEISNILGQKVMTDHYLVNNKGKQYLNLNDQYTGMYIVVVRQSGKIIATKKIIL